MFSHLFQTFISELFMNFLSSHGCEIETFLKYKKLSKLSKLVLSF